MSKSTPRPEVCEGCVASAPSECFGKPCKLEPVYNKKQCPCVDCLVKAMCTAQVMDCEVFAKFNELQQDKTKRRISHELGLGKTQRKISTKRKEAR